MSRVRDRVWLRCRVQVAIRKSAGSNPVVRIFFLCGGTSKAQSCLSTRFRFYVSANVVKKDGSELSKKRRSGMFGVKETSIREVVNAAEKYFETKYVLKKPQSASGTTPLNSPSADRVQGLNSHKSLKTIYFIVVQVHWSEFCFNFNYCCVLCRRNTKNVFHIQRTKCVHFREK